MGHLGRQRFLGPGNLDLNGQVIGTDHSAFHTAAVLLAEGRGDALFDYPDLPGFAARQDELVGKPGFLDPYRNPPFYALLYRPTARLPYLASYAVWAVVGLLVLAGGLRWSTARAWAGRSRGRSASTRCSRPSASGRTRS